MHDDLEMRRKRAGYRASHRGTKEMDIILGRYAEVHLPVMGGEALELFERFLALPDPLLTQWFSQGATDAEAGEMVPLVAALRAHHGMTPAAAHAGLETR